MGGQNIISMVILILVALSVVAIVWNVVGDLIGGTSGGVDIEVFKTKVEILEVKMLINGGAEVVVKNFGELDSLSFLFHNSDGEIKVVSRNDSLPDEFETKSYIFSASETGVIDKVSIVPFIDDKGGLEVFVDNSDIKGEIGGIVDTIPSYNNLVSWWRFEEDGSDSVGNNDGQLFVDASFVDGVLGKAIKTEFAKNAISIPDDDSLDLADELTISFWIYPESGHQGYAYLPLNKWGDTNDANYVFYYFGNHGGQLPQNDRLFVVLANRNNSWSSISGSKILDVGKWSHIVLAYHKDVGGQLYIDGVPHGSRTRGGLLSVNGNPINMGYIDGKMDEIMIYNRELTDEEISSLYFIQSNFV